MDKQTFIKQLSDLIAFETLSDNLKENQKALDYVEKIVHKNAFVKRFKNKNAEILIASNIDTTTPDVGYMAHMDIVAAKPEQFKMQIKNDKLFGRGVSDMKFSIPIGIKLLNDAIEEKLDTSFALMITTDEEIGGFDGASFLADELKFKPKCLIVPDGGDNLSFVNKAKGVCQIFIESIGSPAHASRPWMGKNALEPLTILCTKLIKQYGKNNIKESWKTTMNIGLLQGGVSVNQVCPQAVLKLDLRFPESTSYAEIFEDVKKTALEINPTLKVNLGSFDSPTATDVSLPIVKKFLECMDTAYSTKIEIKPTYGASDARYFSVHGVPILMIKPMGGEIHSDNEWISLSSCLTFFDGIKAFLRKFD